jgi:hypothetical protein
MLAIHEPYRVRARELIADIAPVPVVVLTDEPGGFADLPVRAVAHAPTGPMAVDYRRLAIRTGGGAGAAAYHDKRFALMAALEDYETAIFVDADSRLGRLPALESFPPGVALAPGTRESISDHLGLWGPQRRPMFEALAAELVRLHGAAVHRALVLRSLLRSHARREGGSVLPGVGAGSRLLPGSTDVLG